MARFPIGTFIALLAARHADAAEPADPAWTASPSSTTATTANSATTVNSATAVNSATTASVTATTSPPMASGAKAEPPPSTNEVIVSGRRSSSFSERTQLTGSRASRSVDDVPQAMTVLPEALLDAIGARRVEDAMMLVPGVQLGAGFGGTWDDYFVRGSRVWSGTLYRNGYLGGYSGISAADSVNVERVEVLRGPAAALYGPGLPGGTINVITKRPERTDKTEVGLGVGSFGSQRVTLDATGPLSSRVAYRFAGSFDTTEGFRDHNSAERLVLNPSFVHQLTSRTRWLVESQIFRVRYRPDPSGVPLLNGDFRTLPVQRSLVEPNTPWTTFDGALLRSELSHDVSRHAKVRFGVQRQQALQDERAWFPLGLREDGRTLDRIATHTRLKSEDIAAQAGLELRSDFANVKHDAVFGIDARYERVDYTLATSGTEPYPIDVYDPMHGKAPRVTASAGPESRWAYGDVGLYGSDVIEPHPLVKIVLGGRVDLYRQTSRTPSLDQRKGELAPSGRAGVIFAPLPEVTLYASASRAFWPVLGVTGSGELLAAERSRGLEVGARALLPSPELTLDAALYQVDNRNISVPDPERPEFQVQRGESRSRGLELTATAQPTAHVRVIASYTLAEAKVTADTNPSLVGSTLPFVPRQSASGWLYGSLPSGSTHVEVGVGGLAVGERALNDGTEVPGYARLDASAGFRDRWGSVRLFAQNVLGADYVQSGSGALSVLRGAPRSFFLSFVGRSD